MTHHLPTIYQKSPPPKNQNLSSSSLLSLGKHPKLQTPRNFVRHAKTCLSMGGWCLPGERLRMLFLSQNVSPDSESYRSFSYFCNSRGVFFVFSFFYFKKSTSKFTHMLILCRARPPDLVGECIDSTQETPRNSGECRRAVEPVI